jgi:hypothetical protein
VYIQIRERESKWTVLLLVTFDTFTLGFITLGFEMLAGRMLTPLFGSGIYTWATIIAGGFAADLHPSFALAGSIKVISGLYLLLVYYLLGGHIASISSISDNEIWSLFITGFVVCFPPLLVLGMFAPLAVRLILSDAAMAGRVAGGLFALSSFGNIAGILGTTFALIPNFGTRAITGSFALFLLASAVVSGVVHATLTSGRNDL